MVDSNGDDNRPRTTGDGNHNPLKILSTNDPIGISFERGAEVWGPIINDNDLYERISTIVSVQDIDTVSYTILLLFNTIFKAEEAGKTIESTSVKEVNNSFYAIHNDI